MIKKIITISIVFSLMTCSISFADAEDVSGRVSNGNINSRDAIKEEPGNFSGNIIVTGDSYGGFFINYLKQYGYNIEKNKYNRAQKSVIENEPIYRLAFITGFDNIVLSIGVNDYFNQTPSYAFANVIENLASLGKYYNKRLFLHSYLSIPYKVENAKYTCDDYDIALRQIAEKYDNVEYIDILYLSNNKEYLQDDLIHYNDKMYSILYKKINSIISNDNKEKKVIMNNN